MNDSTENGVISDTLHIKASDKSKMKQVVRAIENVFTTKPPLDDHYLKDQEDADPQGYVYLNLLTNMAQLHTMSVTLPFVKQAIRTFSNCLELNEDGTKVRWRTGLDHIKPDQFSINKNKYADTSLSGGSSENLLAHHHHLQVKLVMKMIKTMVPLFTMRVVYFVPILVGM